ncbi:MAG: hypothetical protein ACTSU2_00720 [Promethearchaeota archaeon]
MSHQGKQKCPYCGKWYKNLNSHISRMHPNEKKVGSSSKGKSTDSLERALAKQFLSSSHQDSDSEFSDKEEKEHNKKDDKKSKKDKKKGKKPTWVKQIVVDYWMTNLHGAEMGIYQKERLMAKNRQFTSNLELIGSVKEEGKPDGMFAYNAESWDNVPLKDLAKKRLVIKWFNGQSVAWLGTIEEMVINTMRSSIGANDFLPAFKILVPRYRYVVDLTKEHTKLPKMGEIFTFALKDEKNDKWDLYTFDENRFTIGSDWNILRGDSEIVGKIDEKKLNIGGKFEVEFYDEDLYKNRAFKTVVILFTMMLKWKDAIKDKIEKIRKYLEDGRIKLDISANEEKFLMNPRSIRR